MIVVVVVVMVVVHGGGGGGCRLLNLYSAVAAVVGSHRHWLLGSAGPPTAAPPSAWPGVSRRTPPHSSLHGARLWSGTFQQEPSKARTVAVAVAGYVRHACHTFLALVGRALVFSCGWATGISRLWLADTAI